MKTPSGLQPLIDDGVIDAVMRPLKSGKEAAVYVVRAGDDIRCAKVYKDMAQRSFQQRVQYQEGRKVRGSREARAIGKASKYGRKQQETAWKNTEVDALYQLRDAGVRVPEPFGYFHGVLVMELVVDADGHSAPRLGEVELSALQARGFHRFLVHQVQKMLCIGLIHGDLSEYNVLVAPDGPVLIDFPQVVSAAGNNAARTMLLRDVNNLTASLGAWAPRAARHLVRRGDVGVVRGRRVAPGHRTDRRVRARRIRGRRGWRAPCDQRCARGSADPPAGPRGRRRDGLSGFAGARGLAVLTGIKTCAGRRRRLGRCQAPRHAMSPSIAQVRKLRNDVAGVDCAHAARVAS
jgi:RIO kinase 1